LWRQSRMICPVVGNPENNCSPSHSIAGLFVECSLVPTTRGWRLFLQEYRKLCLSLPD
jgi:hypothetical protein